MDIDMITRLAIRESDNRLHGPPRPNHGTPDAQSAPAHVRPLHATPLRVDRRSRGDRDEVEDLFEWF